MLVLTAIETGLRWGELVALRPRHVDFLRRCLTVEETIVDVSKRHSPTGERVIVKPSPKDDEARTRRIHPALVEALAARNQAIGLGRDDLLFPSVEKRDGSPTSRNTFRTRVWLPALARGTWIPRADARPPACSRILVACRGVDLKTVMDRMGHSQIQTTEEYLHSQPDADDAAIAAFQRTRQRHIGQ